jgi:hypothetical protein
MYLPICRSHKPGQSPFVQTDTLTCCRVNCSIGSPGPALPCLPTRFSFCFARCGFPSSLVMLVESVCHFSASMPVNRTEFSGMDSIDRER